MSPPALLSLGRMENSFHKVTDFLSGEEFDREKRLMKTIRKAVREEVTALAKAIDEVGQEKSIKADYERLMREFDKTLRGKR